MSIHTHYFKHLSDAEELCERVAGARIIDKSVGAVEIPCGSADDVDYWRSAEEFGAFPCDSTDYR